MATINPQTEQPAFTRFSSLKHGFWVRGLVYLSSVVFFFFLLKLLSGSPLRVKLYGDFTRFFFVILSFAFWACGFDTYNLYRRYSWSIFYYLFHLCCTLSIAVGVLNSPEWYYSLLVQAGLLFAPTFLWHSLRLKLRAANNPPSRQGSLFLSGWYALNGTVLVISMTARLAGITLVNLAFVGFVLGFVFNIFFLVMMQRSKTHPKNKLDALLKAQFRTMLLGLAVPGLPILLLTFLPLLFYGKELVLIEYLLPLGLAVPLAFFYSSRRQQLVAAELRLDRAFLIVFLSFGIGLVYLQVSLGLSTIIRDLHFETEIIILSLTLSLATISYAPLRRKVRRLADAMIYGTHYDYQETLGEITALFTTFKDTRSISQTVCQNLNNVLEVSGCAILLGEQPPQLRQVAGTGILAESGPERILQVVELVRAGKKISILEKSNLGDENLTGQPIKYQNQLKGVLLLGSKLSGEYFSSQDYNLLAVVANHLGAAVENNHLLDVVYKQVTELDTAHQQAHKLNLQLAQVQDQQREELAYLLHDTVLQNIIYITRHTSFCANLLQAPQPKVTGVIEQLQILSDISETSVQELRNICSGLYPLIVDTVGLVGALRWLADKTQRLHQLEVSLELEGITPAQTWPHLVKRNLFNVVQETINNSIKHAHATSIKIALKRTSRGLYVEISDDGLGMSKVPDLGELAYSGHLGLVGSKVRIERVGGLLEIESAEKAGTIVRITIPSAYLNEDTAEGAEAETTVAPT